MANSRSASGWLAMLVIAGTLLFFFGVNLSYDFDPRRDPTQKLIDEISKTNFLISLYISVLTIRWCLSCVTAQNASK